MGVEFFLGADDKIRDKVLGRILSKLFGQVFEHLAEAGLWSFLLKFYFGISLKTAVMIALIVVALSISKKLYYKEDFYLAFAILLIFHESLLLSYILFIYVSYFRGLLGFFNKDKRESRKFMKIKSDYISYLGQYGFPFLILLLGKAFKNLKENILFLIMLAFLHHVNYFVTILLARLIGKQQFSREAILKALKEARLNMLVTILLLLVFKGLILKIAYEEISWGIFDKIFALVGWII